ncbi:MAG: AMP phosphorylase [Candidatus Woesearchaeota archaeon]
MKLKAKVLDLSTEEGPFIAILNEDDARKLDVFALDRVKIIYGKKDIIATLDISNKIVKPGEIGLFQEVSKRLNVKNNTLVEILLEKKPECISYIKKKLKNEYLNKEEIFSIIKSIVNNELSDIELTYFVSACYSNKLSKDETINLIKAILESGGKLELKDKKIIVDKHSIGGVPGNRTTMIIVPILAAAGATIPKTSSRAITSAAGTADTMEVLAPVELSIEKIKQVVEKTNGCIVWGGANELAGADDKLIKIERPLSLDSESLLLASVLSKKISVNATHVLIDIPIGEEKEDAKIQTKREAKKLGKKFIQLGKKFGLKIKIFINDGSEPLGNGIGPNLEARDVLKVLQNKYDAPKDLKNKSIKIAGLMLNMIDKGDEKKAKEILESGRAYIKMKEIIKEQGGDPDITIDEIKLGKFSYNVTAKKEGYVKNVDNKAIAKIARISGAPKDKEAGIYLHVKKGDLVKDNDVLFTVYSKDNKKLAYTLDIFNENDKIVEIS